MVCEESLGIILSCTYISTLLLNDWISVGIIYLDFLLGK